MQKLQMVDVTTQYQRLKSEIDRAMQAVVAGGKYIKGPEVDIFSSSLGNYLGVSHVVPCANGTDALQAALMALDLKPGDEVIAPAFSFIATVEVIALLGLTPVLVDVDPDTFNIDPSEIEKAISPRTRAIIPVHLFGQAPAMDEIMNIAANHNLYVVEDVAQSLGSSFETDGHRKKLGTIGHIGCTSFFPSKNLGGFGDGGACYTNDEVLAGKLQMVVNHGSRKKYYNERIGINSRLDTIQAAVLNEKLKHLDDFIVRRQRAAQFYRNELNEVSFLKLPGFQKGADHSFNQFTIRVLNGERDGLKQFLGDAGIPSMIYYPLPLHKQPVFGPFCAPGFSLPVSEMLSNEVLSLPIHTEITQEQQKYITDKIKQFV